jgi:hypothetical protein
MNGAKPWVVAGSAGALAALAPLMAERRKRQPVLGLVDGAEAVLRDPAPILTREVEAVLVVGPRRRSPRQMLPGLFLRDRAGRRVPVGWIPDVGDGLAVYAEAAARVLRRARGAGPIIVLGQWEDRFLRVGLRTVRWFERSGRTPPVFHWTADRISRENMLRGLAECGPAVAFYFGHGRPRGWAGYHGVRRDHIPRPWSEPMGALLALCCENASRWRTDLSFAEVLTLRGVFGAALAAVTKTRHEHNRRLGPALCEALTTQPVRTLAGLVAALPEDEWEQTPYRFIGDPAMPLSAAAEAVARAAAVFAPAPDEPLPAWQEATA